MGQMRPWARDHGQETNELVKVVFDWWHVFIKVSLVSREVYICYHQFLKDCVMRCQVCTNRYVISNDENAAINDYYLRLKAHMIR